MRLINAEDLMRKIEKRYLDACIQVRRSGKVVHEGIAVGMNVARNIIIEQPTIEAEPVVRCKDCVCSSTHGDMLICERISDVMDGYYHGTVDVVKPDDFCSHGARQKAKVILNGGE